jgi:hypothetical protein
MALRLPALLLVVLFSISCTSSRWIVTDQNAIDTRTDPVVLGEKSVLLVDSDPSVDDPVMRFRAHRVIEKEYEQRVKMERTIQKYRPKWGFLLLGVSGALFAATAANSDLVFSSASSDQQLALNITSVVLAGLSVVNMTPSGDPIYTGETELMRKSGYEVVYDTLRSETEDFDFTVNLDVAYEGETILSQSDLSLTNGGLDINLATVADYLEGDVGEESSVHLSLYYNDERSDYHIPVNRFLAPFVTVTSPVAVLRNAPVINEMNVITEVGEGSSLRLIDRDLDDWYRVRFGGSEVFLAKNSGGVEWMSEAESGTPDVFEFEEAPFGDIDVESSVPILKQNNPADRAIILTNGIVEGSELRQYLARDHQLFRFYMRYALQMSEDQIHTIEMEPDNDWQEQLQAVAEMDTTGSLFVYLSGFATLTDQRTLYLDMIDELDGPGVLTSFIFEQFERINPSSLFLMADFEFSHITGTDGLSPVRSAYGLALQDISNQLLRRIPNSVILFSNRPGQSSSLYTGGGGMENKRHHIFNYYWAEAIKQRRTRMSDIIRHLENNVDYTSRRLHDRPQEIQAFGNFTLNITD